mgnify:CR=1 FL=1
MDERVIAAAAQGIVDGTRNWSRDRVPAEWPVEFAQAEAAIKAADAARAPEIIAAVEDIADAACDRCSESGGYQSDKDRVFADARRELLALFGIEATP